MRTNLAALVTALRKHRRITGLSDGGAAVIAVHVCGGFRRENDCYLVRQGSARTGSTLRAYATPEEAAGAFAAICTRESIAAALATVTADTDRAPETSLTQK